MSNDRNIGRVASVDSLMVSVCLDEDLKSMYKNGYEEIYPIARINSYIIIPIGAEKVVAMVTRVSTREETNLSKSSGSIFFTESKCYLSATMVGTINDKGYIQGVYNYPIIDNPVWYVTRDDLNIIFDQKDINNVINFRDDFYLPIGTSPSFPDFEVKINPDKMFAKHVAILGNTGSGKSCTMTALLQSLFRFEYNKEKLKSAHIVIFDTNGEYKAAFNLNAQHQVNPFWISDEGIKLPYWFMNYDDLDYLFEPTTGTQGPILKRALGLAKSGAQTTKIRCMHKLYVNKLTNFIATLEQGDWTSSKAIYYDATNLYNAFLSLKNSNSVDFDLTHICEALEKLKKEKDERRVVENNGYINGSPDLVVTSDAITKIRQELDKYHIELEKSITSENRNIDLPVFYDFHKMMTSCFDMAIQESATSPDKISEYVSTLRLRMQSFVDDVRLSEPLMMSSKNNGNLLLEFLAYVLGDYCRVYNNKDERSIYDDCYEKIKSNDERSQITIIDMSLLPFQVLETITGLIGRMILEFLSRFDKDRRGSTPIVIALEEAQNYIPEINRKDRESISKKVFERIAREGRKYGLSLLLSSQRPSELSKTVLSQCNSFIIHRIQNPDDQAYIRKLVSSASSEILEQLPSLPQQHAVLMGDCVRTPIVVKINTANPRPYSDNPEFIKNWIEEKYPDYSSISKKWLEQNDNEEGNEA